MIKKSLKTLVYIGAALILIVVAAAVFTQTAWFRDMVKTRIVEAANASLDARVSIARLDGNLFSRLILRDLLVAQEADSVLFLPETHIAFKPLPLLRNRIEIDAFEIVSPRLALRQRADSSWNVASLIPPAAPDAAEEPAAPLEWTIALSHAKIRDGKIVLDAEMEAVDLPNELQDLQMTLSASYEDGLLGLDLRELECKSLLPELRLHTLRFTASMQDSALQIRDALLKFGASELSLRGTIGLSPRQQSTAAINVAAFALADVQPFVESPLPGGTVSGRIESSWRADSADAQAEFRVAQQQFRVQGRVNGLNSVPRYEATGEFRELNLAHWLADSQYRSRLSGDFSVQGRGTKADSLLAGIILTLQAGEVQHGKFDMARLRADYTRGDARVKASTKGGFGSVVLSADARSVLDVPSYTLDMVATSLNLEPFSRQPEHATNLNFSLSAKGKGADPATARATLNAKFGPSTWQNARLDTLFTAATITRTDFQIDTLYASGPVGNFAVTGRLSLDASSDLALQGTVGDLRFVEAALGADTLRARGRIMGKLSGPPDSLFATLRAELAKLSYNTASADSVHLVGEVRRTPERISGAVQAKMMGAGTSAFSLDSVVVDASFLDETADATIDFAKDTTLAGSFAVRYATDADSVPAVFLPEFRVRIAGRELTGGGPTERVRLLADGYEIEGLQIGDGDQTMTVDGTLRTEGEQNLEAKLRNFNLKLLSALLDGPRDIEGILEGDMQLRGTLDAPVLYAKVNVPGGRFSEFKYEQISGHVDFRADSLLWELNLRQNQQQSLTAFGYLPVHLQAEGDESIVPLDQPFRFQMTTQGLDLAFLQAFTDKIRNVGGTLVCDLQISNTIENPQPLGRLRVLSGRFRVPQFGINYRDIQVVLHVSEDRINVTEFDIGTEVKTRGAKKQGRFWVEQGSFAAFDSAGMASGIRSADIRLRADNFLVVNSSDYQARIAGDVKIAGDLRAPRFSGNMGVLRSSVYYPALEETGLYDEETISTSLLRQAIADTVKRTQVKRKADPDEPSIAYLENMRGSIRVDIPRNTWLRGPEMNIELSGSLEILKNGTEFEQPFGTINIVRGSYDFLNAYRFDILEGEIIFDGGQEFNPKVNLKARHILRLTTGANDRVKKDLEMTMTGRLFAPDFTFMLDRQEIDLRNTFYLLVFGKPADQLNSSIQADAFSTGAEGKNAESVLAGVLAAQLSRSIGKKLSLDVLEISGEQDWNRASVVIGKYLTDKLFVSLQQNIQIGSSGQGLSNQLTFEYELLRQLLIQLTTDSAGQQQGLDFIWKFSK